MTTSTEGTPTGETGQTPVAPTPPAPVTPTPPVKLDTTEGTTPTTPPAPPSEVAPGEVFAFDPTGDPGLDVALAFVGNLGIPGDHPAMVAAGQGDFGLIKAHLATMGDTARGWEQMVALAEDAVGRITAAETAKNDAVTKAVHDIAGGADNWNAVAAWAASTASPTEKAEINAMFDTGPVGARAAAKMLVELYGNAKGTTINPSAATRNAGAGGAVADNGALSPRDYYTAVNELRHKLGLHSGRLEASPEYAQLRARLAAYRG